MFSVRLDEDWIKKIQLMAEKAKASKSELVREALTEYLEPLVASIYNAIRRQTVL